MIEFFNTVFIIKIGIAQEVAVKPISLKVSQGWYKVICQLDSLFKASVYSYNHNNELYWLMISTHIGGVSVMCIEDGLILIAFFR